jgi:hypothetical protein
MKFFEHTVITGGKKESKALLFMRLTHLVLECTFLRGCANNPTLQINPYRQRLASKLAIFLTIMSRIRRDGRYEVGTLLERLEPTELIEAVQSSKQRRNTLITQWDNALLTLHELGWQIEFDAATYPECIRPEWSLTSSLRRKLRYHCTRYRVPGDGRFEWYLYFRLGVLVNLTH